MIRVCFDSIFEDIYPAELTLLNTNISPCKVTFLDLAISLHRGKFKHCLYDKRKDFDFSVITYPFLSGNIPKVPSYGVYMSQLLRVCQICGGFSGFKNEVINLHKKLDTQGFEVVSLNYSAVSTYMFGVHSPIHANDRVLILSQIY